jgi:hypothetical protein
MEQDIKCYLNDSEVEWRRIIVPTMQPSGTEKRRQWGKVWDWDSGVFRDLI